MGFREPFETYIGRRSIDAILTDLENRASGSRNTETYVHGPTRIDCTFDVREALHRWAVNGEPCGRDYAEIRLEMARAAADDREQQIRERQT